MAARRSILSLAVAAVAFCLLRSTLAPAFAGSVQKPAVRGSHTAMQAKRIEIFVTNPSVGARTRMMVSPSMTCDEIVEAGRKELGFDQPWIKNDDFNLYKSEDESTPITGTVAENGLKPWGPDGTELHLIFQPGN
mmetsp:Transcript_132827/g.343664  ORF Transcript_132827/g.343664 Transcript_132827/m.343664 type:complete len:135 (-) Transcript_132827:124-528(-)|eukprot:CAMPEP_0115284832 /NCGR_PEP_ID=MMETSP0270-20121206/61108_1 /TAXON_ID=71861 /ORGANISM="Scrippsiella trochoidea, Strain CCMP3099" /LENGTH=134 /DNA_ID=CAMNT_0002701815 /DNA_START=69 /DNA_END=473 /DNA_ORIENTATION=+